MALKGYNLNGIDIPVFPADSLETGVNGRMYFNSTSKVVRIYKDSAWHNLVDITSDVASLNSLTGAINLVAGSGVSVTPSGQNITIANTQAAGANTTLSNLTSPTNGNQDFNLQSSKVFRTKNNAFFTSRNAADNTDIPLIGVDTFNRTNISALSGQNILMNNNIIPAIPDSLSLGVVGDPFLNIVSDTFTLCNSGASLGQLDVTSNDPLGNGANTGVVFRTNTPNQNMYIFTQNSSSADTVATKDLYFETGNKTAGTGNSGSLHFIPGTSFGGFRGNNIFASNIIPDVNNAYTIGNPTTIYSEIFVQQILADSTLSISIGDRVLFSNDGATTNLDWSIPNSLKVPATTAGSAGPQTINQMSGQVIIAAGGSSLVVTNNTVSATSTVLAVIQSNDVTAVIKNVVPTAGSFTIRTTAAVTADTTIAFFVINQQI